MTDATDSHQAARLRRLSIPLATEVNPVTLEVMRQANVQLEARLAALQSVQEAVKQAESELRRAVHEWFMHEERELVVGFDDSGEDVPMTLARVREEEKFAVHAWVFHSVVEQARFPRYLCESCHRPSCGGTEMCGEAEQAADLMAGGDLRKYNDWVLKTRMPARVKTAMGLVVKARTRLAE